MLKTEFTEILREHKDALSDKKRFAAIMKDMFPDQVRGTNLLSALLDMDLPAEINTAAQITNAFAYRFVKRLIDEHGVSRINADRAVSMWCACYGKDILGKPCEIKYSDAKNSGEPAIREDSPGKMQYQDLFLYAKNHNTPGYAITGFTGANRRTVICPNRYGSHPVTAIAANAFSESDVQEAVMTDGLLTIGERAFNGCSQLKQVIFPDSLKEIGNFAFSGCAALSTALLPPRLERLGSYSFASSGIKIAVIPSTVYWLGEGAYSNCGNITEMRITENIATLPDKLFMGCGALKKVTLHNRIESIGAMAFAECASLASLTVPDSVTQIGDYAFPDMCDKFILICGRGSYAETYARKNNIRFQFV
ncbi:hypothetical protein FACS1894167_06760 [Synergistales bacterium]|nr:hypothetical protein FACS1894167_06760 [Synergistales bacterium]